MTPALTALFDRDDVGRQRVSVPAGATLFEPGDAADHLFLLREGMMAAYDAALTDMPRVAGFIRRGETVGEMSLLAGTTRTRSVAALRDCVVDAIDRRRLMAGAAYDPAIMLELAALIARRTSGSHTPTALPRAVLIAGLDGGPEARAMAEALAAACRDLRLRSAAIGHGPAGGDPAAITQAEQAHDLIFVAAEAHEAAWAEACYRHVDRLLLLGHAGRLPPPVCGICPTEPLQANGLVDLVLLDAGGATAASGDDWLMATGAARLHRVGGDPSSIARLARILTGTSVGLALSGGGARAFAHVGAVRALREAGVPIDAVAGTSMGAIIAAGIASGWCDRELDARMRDAFVTSSPLDDIALPIVAMTRGRKVDARLRRHFGDRRIEDLAIPFLCGAANLTTGRYDRHERGPLVEALRASISLPGILPPVVRDGCVLVDGGLLRNLPSDVMREGHAGTVIGCDVSRAIGLDPLEIRPPRSWLGWFASGAWRRGPPLVSILMRSATIATRAEIANARSACDLYVMPELDMIEIRDWQAYPRAVEAGYRAMADAIASADAPITHLRARREARPMPIATC